MTSPTDARKALAELLKAMDTYFGTARGSAKDEDDLCRELNIAEENARAVLATAPAGEPDELATLKAKLNSPITRDFLEGVMVEVPHQRERWGSEHDAGKAPQDWFWLLGYLSGKALRAHVDGDLAKAMHHTISSAAVLANWHAVLLGTDNSMRPGIDPNERKI